MTDPAVAAETEPNSTEYAWAWVAYALYATGVFGFVPGPLIGLVVNYARRNAGEAGCAASHHRWLIRTFWWTVLWYLACLALILAGAWPIIGGLIDQAVRAGSDADEISIGIDWDAIFATIGGAMAGGLGIVVVWIWNTYRLLRGGFLLADRAPAP
jgi:uncharacterized membrane protein